MAEKKKLVDAKGKLFGKINVIDLVVLALILVIAVVVGIKLIGRGAGLPSEGTGVNLSYTVSVSRVPQEVYDSIAAKVDEGGDNVTLMANGDKLTGSYVESVFSTPHKEAVELADGRMILSDEPGYVDVSFAIHAVVTNRITQAVGTQEIRVGKSHIVKTVGFELINGIIITCDVVEAKG